MLPSRAPASSSRIRSRPTAGESWLLSVTRASIVIKPLGKRHMVGLYSACLSLAESSKTGDAVVKISARNQLKGTVVDVIKASDVLVAGRQLTRMAHEDEIRTAERAVEWPD